MFDFYSAYHIVEFVTSAAEHFDDLKRAKIRIGAADLKIASIAILNNALLLTAKRQDFEKVPGLRFANWMD